MPGFVQKANLGPLLENRVRAMRFDCVGAFCQSGLIVARWKLVVEQRRLSCANARETIVRKPQLRSQSYIEIGITMDFQIEVHTLWL